MKGPIREGLIREGGVFEGGAKLREYGTSCEYNVLKIWGKGYCMIFFYCYMVVTCDPHTSV